MEIVSFATIIFHILEKQEIFNLPSLNHYVLGGRIDIDESSNNSIFSYFL